VAALALGASLIAKEQIMVTGRFSLKKSCLIACALAFCASTAGADVVVDWNIRATESIGAGGRRGPSSIFDYAMVHAAMHDAVQAFEHRFEPYCAAVPDAAGSPIAAVAAAAHRVLVALFPAQKDAIDVAYATSLEKYGVTGNMGVYTGRDAADCVLGRLLADNLARAEPDTFIGEHAIGAWRPTSKRADGSEVPMIAEFVGTFTPFTLSNPAQFRLPNAPPKLTSGAYAKAYNEVKTLGAVDSKTRTQAQTNLGRFYSDGVASIYNRTMRDLSDKKGLDIGDRARLFALVNLAMADAIISCWDSKVAWNFWRPITAIQEGELDDNVDTIGDLKWAPLTTTPNYPDYTSGANNFSGAATTMLANFFGTDTMAFTLTSTTIAAPDNVREYTRFSDAARDVVDARVYLGIHFRFADTTALRQGAHVANWAFGHFLRPIAANDN
jgi:hypothetical protein